MSEKPALASVAHIQPYPLLWPERVPRSKRRSGSTFRVTWAVAIKDLLAEIARFASSHVVTSNITGLSADLIVRVAA